MDDLYNNGLENNENGQASGSDGYGDYLPPPTPQNGYGNNPLPPQNGYGNYPPPPQNGYGNYPPPPQNGYGNYPPPPQNGYGNYPPPPQNGYGNYPPPPQYANRAAAAPKKDDKKALVAMILALANLFIFASILTFISAPVAIILALVTLVKKKDGKIMAWIALGATAVSLIIFGLYVDLAVNIVPEINYFSDHHEEIMTEYEETGKLPSRYKKFRAGRYAFIWKSAGFKDFDDAFDKFAEVYKESNKDKGGIKAYSSRDEDATKEPATKDYDHSGEDLVVLG